MKIQLMDVKTQHVEVAEEINKVIAEVVDSCNFILGPNVKAAEAEIASFCEAGFGVGVANGTDALVLGLRAFGVKPGDEVITTPYTFYATAESIAAVGAKPVFVDVEKSTMNIDPNKVKEAITAKTKALLPVHIFGYPAEMDALNEIGKQNGLPVFEDACQAIGAKYKGRRVGGLGDASAFSFFPTKNLSCMGDGGMLVTNSQELADEVRILRFHGSKDKKVFDEVGYNSRLDELQAAILRVKLKKIDEWNGNRRIAAQKLSAGLKDYVEVPVEEPTCVHVYHLYVIRSKHRQAIQNALSQNDIAAAVYYGVPMHLQPVFNELGYQRGDFPVAESAADEGLAIPMHPFLTDDEIEKIISTIRNAVESVS